MSEVTAPSSLDADAKASLDPRRRPGRRSRGLRQARQAAGLTQRQLAFEGCTSAYVSRIEAGGRAPSSQIIREFAQRLGVDTEYLATGRLKGKDSGSILVEAEIALHLGEEELAAGLFEKARDEAAHPADVMRAKLGLGLLAVGQGDHVAGAPLLEQLIESGGLSPEDASAAARALGRSYLAQGRAAEAFAVFNRGLDEARRRKDRFDQIRFVVLLASASADLGDTGAAAATLSEVVELAAENLEPGSRASLYWSLSRSYRSQGENDRAEEHARNATAVLKASGHTREAEQALPLLAKIENDRGNSHRALELLDKPQVAVAEGRELGDAARFAIERARALDSLGDWEEARSLLLAAIPLRRRPRFRPIPRTPTWQPPSSSALTETPLERSKSTNAS